MRKTLFFKLTLFLLIISNSLMQAQNADQIIIAMGPGANIGNVYDNGVESTLFASVKPIIDGYAAAGMKHVRIPVTWMTTVDGNVLADYNGNIDVNNQRFKDMVLSVDYAISKGLYVVLNTHHEEWLKDNYDGSVAYDNRFASLWNKIANYFKSRSSKLIFEVLNEPEGLFGQDDGAGPWPSPGTGNTNLYTRNINKVGYDAIRATGGNNTTRLIMVSPNGQSADQNIKAIWPNIASLPGVGNDDYLALSVHSYDPWNFCGQTGNNANYTSATINSKISSEILQAATDANSLGLPVNYGEFGVGRDVEQYERDQAIVKDYYKTVANTTIANNMSFTVWDDRGWYSLINDAGTAFTYNIVPYMLQGLPTPAPSVTASFATGANTAIQQGESKAIEVLLNPAVAANNNQYNVKLYLNNVKITKEENISPYNWGLEVPELTNMAAGSYTLRALVTTIASGVTTEVTTTFTVNAISNGPQNLTTSYFQLVNQGTGDYLKSISNSTTTTGVIIQESQTTPPPATWNSFQWYFVQSAWADNYHVFNKNTVLNFYPEAYGITANLGMRQSAVAHNDYTAESWQIELSNVTGYYWIKNRKSGLYLQPLNSSQTSGTQIVQNVLSTTDASFRWQFVKISDKTARITNNSKALSTTENIKVLNDNLKVYPNPVNDVLNVMIPNSNNSNTIEVYSVIGQKVFAKSVTGLKSIEIDVSKYSQGTYFVRLIGTEALNAKFIVD